MLLMIHYVNRLRSATMMPIWQALLFSQAFSKPVKRVGQECVGHAVCWYVLRQSLGNWGPYVLSR